MWSVHWVAMFCYIFFWKFWLPIGLHSSCSISQRTRGTYQKCSTKYHDWEDAPQYTTNPINYQKTCYTLEMNGASITGIHSNPANDSDCGFIAENCRAHRYGCHCQMRERELARVQCTAPGNRGENVTGLRMVEKLMMTWCGGENLLLSTSMHFPLKPALSGSSVHYALCFVP